MPAVTGCAYGCPPQRGYSARHEVRQFHFTAWPEHGVPYHATGLLAFIRRVKASTPPDAGPVVIHCRWEPAGEEGPGAGLVHAPGRGERTRENDPQGPFSLRALALRLAPSCDPRDPGRPLT